MGKAGRPLRRETLSSARERISRPEERSNAPDSRWQSQRRSQGILGQSRIGFEQIRKRTTGAKLAQN
jgi:hypothetical protein